MTRLAFETHYGETMIRLAEIDRAENARREQDHARIVAAMTEDIRDSRGYDLVYVAYDDSLTDEQADAYIDRDNAPYALLDADLDEWQSERAYDAAMDVLGELATRHGVNLEELPEDDVDELRGLVYEKDTSDPVEELARVTGSRLFRVPLTGFDRSYDLFNDADTDGPEEALFAVAKGLTDVGIEAHEALRWAQEVLPECGDYLHEEFTLDVIWYGPLTAIGDLKAGDTLTFTNPYVVLLDHMNGAGHDQRVTGTLTVTVNDDHMPHLDATGGGYGWDATAGVVHSAYASDVTVTRKDRKS